jgi:hypothetical protein
MVAGRDRMGPAAALRGIRLIAVVLAPMPRCSLTARLGARVAHRVSRRRLCFANYLIALCGQFGLGLALT